MIKDESNWYVEKNGLEVTETDKVTKGIDGKKSKASKSEGTTRR